eukprot:gnl/Trimastix_PCT/750.p1 GENE.gnl/Trimastix_PCT/750~~gnl/Trimastix_PCT/750.p1  ORF type:complete len:1166 (-),score=486.01 gnl/Trimastix_PCT/750:907-4029(-)
MDNLSSGIYISHTVESVLDDRDGKQLMTEALYLYGVMLLLLDARIEGVVRERLLISFYRYKGPADVPNIEDVCMLCRSTGFTPGAARRLANYPEDYFARMTLPRPVIQLILGRLRSDDIYNQIANFPQPEHRSTALASQASMLYIILFFAPELLQRENATMREICDKYFSDNWIISYYMGFVVDLSVAWEPYRAARAALASTIALQNVRQVHARHIQNYRRLRQDLKQYLTEGVLVEEYVLDNIQPLLHCLRDSNVTLRWIMLHQTSKQKKIADVAAQGITKREVLHFLLLVSQFEFILKRIFQHLLNSKQERWNALKGNCTERMTELAEYFSGNRMLSRITKNEDLESWFKSIGGEIGSLDYSDATLAGRKIQQLVVALEEIEQFQQIENSLQIKQFLADTRSFLLQMIRTVNVSEGVMVNITVVADMSYGWEILGEFVPLMQEAIKERASVVLQLRSTFLKLASVLDQPLVRVMQAKSPDQESVAQYYSSELVAFVRRVLEIVPVSMFSILNEIFDIQTNRLRELPAKLPKDQLREFAQYDVRQHLAAATHQISVFTEGILAMKKTLIGVIQVDPKQLLEDGVRKELVRQITFAMHQALQFPQHRLQEFEHRLQVLAARLDGFKRSFEYIQDYVNMYGLKIWQEETSRIMNYSIEQECNVFLKKKVYDWQSKFQSDAVPIPVLPPTDDKSVNFVGRLSRELLELTSPRRVIYSRQNGAWIDPQTHSDVVGVRTFALMNHSVGVTGLCGVDRFLGFIITRDLVKFTQVFRREVDRTLLQQLGGVYQELQPLTSNPPAALRIYQAAEKRVSRLWPFLLDIAVRIGQCQLLRLHLQNELNFSCQLDSNVLASTLTTMNSALLNDVAAHYNNPEQRPYPSVENPLLSELSQFLDAAGMGAPLDRIYIASDPLSSLDFVLFLFVLHCLPKLAVDPSLGLLVGRSTKDGIDGIPLTVGLATLLRQFHSIYIRQFVQLLGQHIRVSIDAAKDTIKSSSRDGRATEFPPEVRHMLCLATDFARYASLPDDVFDAAIPRYLLEGFLA